MQLKDRGVINFHVPMMAPLFGQANFDSASRSRDVVGTLFHSCNAKANTRIKDCNKMPSTTIYVPLDKESEEGEQFLDTIPSHGQHTSWTSWRSLHLLIIALYTTGFLVANRSLRNATERECVEQLSSWCER